MANAEQVFAHYLSRLQQQALANLRGHERSALIELVRGLDHAAFAIMLAPNRAELIERDQARLLMIHGAAPALRPFLESLRNTGGGVPWQPTNRGRSNWADNFLMQCGLLSHLQRLAAFEKFGLSSAKFVGKRKLILEVQDGSAERADRAAASYIRELKRDENGRRHITTNLSEEEVLRRIDQYVGLQWGWSIRYDSDKELLSHYRALATIWAPDCAEAEALPQNAVIAGRSFSDWCQISETALGRILHHIAFATRLTRVKPELDLRNLLSMYARKDDIIALWEQSGESPERIGPIMDYLALDADSVPHWQAKHEIPLPYYIELGKDFVMLPIFGGLLNPHAGLAWTLRDRYRDEWNISAAGRERVFRTNLRRVLPNSRFTVFEKGVVLRRDDGSPLTDVDAVVFDRAINEVGLFQLKWYDAVGFSVDEWGSRRRNLLDANRWVDRVSKWLTSRSLQQALEGLGVPSDGVVASPFLFVLVRNELRFTGSETYDLRAAWLRWSELVRAVEEMKAPNLLRSIWNKYRHDPPRRKRRGRSESKIVLSDLTVELRVR